jgi:hypothetical protein
VKGNEFDSSIHEVELITKRSIGVNRAKKEKELLEYMISRDNVAVLIIYRIISDVMHGSQKANSTRVEQASRSRTPTPTPNPNRPFFSLIFFSFRQLPLRPRLPQPLLILIRDLTNLNMHLRRRRNNLRVLPSVHIFQPQNLLLAAVVETVAIDPFGGRVVGGDVCVGFGFEETEAVALAVGVVAAVGSLGGEFLIAVVFEEGH